MNLINRYILLLAPALLVFQIGLSNPTPNNIVNIHESVEKFADITKLQSTMGRLGMTNAVLHGIPTDILRFDPEGDEIDLHDANSNHDYLIQATEVYPDDFSFFCTIEPDDPQWEAKMLDCIDEGAIGIKMYAGYSYAHTKRLDSEIYSDFYSELSDTGMILMFPVNVSKYQEELENILERNQDLTVVCPHYCLSSKDLSRLSDLLYTYPNLFVDSSFGHEDFVRDGFATITANRGDFLNFFKVHQDRILFATDNVVTTYEDKSEDYLFDLYSDYLSILSEGKFMSVLDGVEYYGLNLPYPIQRKVFWQNWAKLLE